MPLLLEVDERVIRKRRRQRSALMSLHAPSPILWAADPPATPPSEPTGDPDDSDDRNELARDVETFAASIVSYFESFCPRTIESVCIVETLRRLPERFHALMTEDPHDSTRGV